MVEVSEKLKAAARKLRLNTDNKRSVFYLLNTCMDFMDAATKIVEMRLKGSQRQDVLFVILEIVMRLKKWNTFYVLTLGNQMLISLIFSQNLKNCIKDYNCKIQKSFFSWIDHSLCRRNAHTGINSASWRI